MSRKRPDAGPSAPAPAEDGPPTPRSKREHRKHITRRELLEAGRKLFGEQGLYDCRIEDLSRHAGIAKGTLYGYFESKDDLMAAVVTTGFNELLGHTHRAAQAARTYPELLAAVARAHLDFYEANPDLLRIFHQVRGLLKYGRSESQALRPALAGFLAGLAHVLSMPAAGPRRTAEAATESAGLLFGAVSGIASTRASQPRPAGRARDTEALVRSLVALVLAYEGR